MKQTVTHLFLLLFVAQASSAVLAAGVPATGSSDCFDGAVIVTCATTVSPPLSYTKLDAMGNSLPTSTMSWACVRDNVTGLVWESKTTDGGLRDANHRYAWFSSSTALNGGEPGAIGDTTTCAASLGAQACTTDAFVAAVNAVGLCGTSDWRMPMQSELSTLVHAGSLDPAIDSTFFPETQPRPYWSANTHAMYPASAWGIHFGYGAAHAESKNAANPVRLVRGTWSR